MKLKWFKWYLLLEIIQLDMQYSSFRTKQQAANTEKAEEICLDLMDLIHKHLTKEERKWLDEH
jgi:hypothetical protein